MSDKYLDMDQSQLLQENIRQYELDPPAEADPVLDALDLVIAQSEAIPTTESMKVLSNIRRADAARSELAAESQDRFKPDAAMGDLDCILRVHAAEANPLSTARRSTPASSVQTRCAVTTGRAG